MASVEAMFLQLSEPSLESDNSEHPKQILHAITRKKSCPGDTTWQCHQVRWKRCILPGHDATGVTLATLGGKFPTLPVGMPSGANPV